MMLPQNKIQDLLAALRDKYSIYERELKQNKTSGKNKIVIQISQNQHIILLHTPDDSQKIVYCLQDTLFNHDLITSCIVMLTSKGSQSAFFKPEKQVVGPYTIQSRAISDGQTLLLPGLVAEYLQFSIDVTANSQQTQHAMLYHCPLFEKSILKDNKLLINNINHALQYLLNDTNIAICSNTFHGRVIHIMLALYFLCKHNEIYSTDNIYSIADEILKICKGLHDAYGLSISIDQIEQAVQLTDYIHKNKYKFPRTEIMNTIPQDNTDMKQSLLDTSNNAKPKRRFCNLL